jgi:hypothetical protein
MGVNAQMLDNSNCDVFSENNFFNDEFIRKNGIIGINSTISSKQEMKPIKETGLWQQYDFDKYGRVKRMMETKKVGSIVDTSLVEFKYAGDRLNKKRLSDASGFYSYAYQYNDQGKLTQKTYSREVNANPYKHKFELKQLIEIYKERYEHTKISDASSKVMVYNSSDKPFQKLFTQYDEYGNLIKETATLVVTKKTEVNNLMGKEEYRYEYDYDEAGNLLEERTYLNDEHTTTRQFLYDGRMLLSARLTKDIKTGTIQIVKYTCQFD